MPATEPAGTVTHGTITFAGRERTYRRYTPSVLPDGPVPLFIGCGREVDFPPPRDGFEAIAAFDGCPDAHETIDGDITTALREPCDAGSAAAFVTIATAGHAWPGGTPGFTPASGVGYADYDATAELVEFLLSHARP